MPRPSSQMMVIEDGAGKPESQECGLVQQTWNLSKEMEILRARPESS